MVSQASGGCVAVSRDYSTREDYEDEVSALKVECDGLIGANTRLRDENGDLRAALEGVVKALEDGEEQGFLHMHIVTALDIARRALEGK